MTTLSSLITLHPATVHFPIGLLILASAAGLLYLYWKPHAPLVILIWWPMLIGWVSCALAVLTGLLAQSDLPPDAPYWQLLNFHVTTGLAILLLYGTPLYLRWTRRSNDEEMPGYDAVLDSTEPMMRLGITFCFVVGGLLVLLTGWSGGQLVYGWGVGVN